MEKRSLGIVITAAVVAVAIVPALAFGAGGWSASESVRDNGWARAAMQKAAEPAKGQGQLNKIVLPQGEEEAVAQEVAEEAAVQGLDVVEAVAQESEPAAEVQAAVCPGFEDLDNDGICDHWSEGACPSHHWQDVEQGFEDGSAFVCPGFEDADGDGICDYWESGACPSGHWCANAQGGYGCGNGYVDADDNGVCDNWEEGVCPGNGAGNGSGAGAGAGAGWGAGNGNGWGAGHGHGGGHGRCWR